MRKYGVIIAICLLVVVNAVVLGGIAYNRSGESAATITLTQRELPFASYYDYSDRENTGLSLRIGWSRDEYLSPLFSFSKTREDGDLDWFNKAKLEAIGFDCGFPLSDSKADLHYRKILPRKTYAVLEFEGTAWDRWLSDQRADLDERLGGIKEEKLKATREEFERRLQTHTRLFAIDAGNDLDVLRTKYNKPERYMILPATVRLQYHEPYAAEGEKKEPPSLRGRITDILTDTIYVPKEHRAILEKILMERAQKQEMNNDFRGYSKHGPAYAVTLKVGKRAEPWIVGVRELPAKKAK
jgi:hypothetical protein